MRTLLFGTLGVAALAAAGCGGGTADVAGTVTFKGKPVVYGTVTMIDADGIPKRGVIQPDGTYRVPSVRVGTAKVTVSSPPPPGSEPDRRVRSRGGRDGGDEDKKRPPPPPPAPPEVLKNWIPLPDKYADPDKSGLTVTLAGGDDPLNIDLK